MTWQAAMTGAGAFVALALLTWLLEKIFDRTVAKGGRALWDKWVASRLRRNERFKADVARASLDPSFALSRFALRLALLLVSLGGWIMGVIFTTSILGLHA